MCRPGVEGRRPAGLLCRRQAGVGQRNGQRGARHPSCHGDMRKPGGLRQPGRGPRGQRRKRGRLRAGIRFRQALRGTCGATARGTGGATGRGTAGATERPRNRRSHRPRNRQSHRPRNSQSHRPRNRQSHRPRNSQSHRPSRLPMADERSQAERWVSFAAGIVTPMTLITALLFYFGYVSARSQYEYFGIDVDTIGLSTQDYVMRSPAAPAGPIAGAHPARRRRTAVAQRDPAPGRAWRGTAGPARGDRGPRAGGARPVPRTPCSASSPTTRSSYRW